MPSVTDNNIVLAAMSELRAAAAKHKAAVVAFSGGKDSTVVLDLAVKCGFERIEAFYFSFVPDIEFEEKNLRAAEERYPGLIIRRVPHPASLWAYGHAMFCDGPEQAKGFPNPKLRDMYDLILEDLNCTLLLTGNKMSDNMYRKRLMKNGMHKWTDVMHPVGKWNKHDITSYLAMRGIPMPESQDGQTGGVGIAPGIMCYLHDNHPEDFKRILEYFPYVEAYIKRREFFGTSGE